MRIFKGFILGFVLLCSGLEAKWHDKYFEAVKQAEKEKKPLLVAFLGPNWCPWSDQLEAEVLANPQFLAEMEKEFVLVKIDIPEDFEGASFPGKELKNQLKVEECPSIVLLQPTGEEIAMLAYLPIDPREFSSYIKETLADFRKVSRITKKQLDHMKVEDLKSIYAKAGRLADETFKKAVLTQGLKIDRDPFFLLEEYGNLLIGGKANHWKIKSLRKKIVDRDPDNEGGFLRQLAVMDFEALTMIKKHQKAEIVVKPLVEYLQHFGKKDPENAWRIEMKVSQYFFTHNRIDEALHHAEASLQIAPEECKKEIVQSIEYLKTYYSQ